MRTFFMVTLVTALNSPQVLCAKKKYLGITFLQWRGSKTHFIFKQLLLLCIYFKSFYSSIQALRGRSNTSLFSLNEINTHFTVFKNLSTTYLVNTFIKSRKATTQRFNC